ncbi:hypothetical protein [Streptomyces sp. SLBN-31]|uniref:hypothetical protein n=1 Tax=Streptomyces sp. SLBN-31 TaxID=2768444 RepID=UPI0028C48147|nr:hypothetical protein [Streptomyces sp. SLBN-31]
MRREPSPSDRRVKNVLLTEEGEQVIDVIRGKTNKTLAGLSRLASRSRTLCTHCSSARSPLSPPSPDGLLRRRQARRDQGPYGTGTAPDRGRAG